MSKYAYDYYENFERLKILNLDVGQKIMFNILSRFTESKAIKEICTAMEFTIIHTSSYVSFTTMNHEPLLLSFL